MINGDIAQHTDGVDDKASTSYIRLIHWTTRGILGDLKKLHILHYTYLLSVSQQVTERNSHTGNQTYEKQEVLERTNPPIFLTLTN
jgi:hypothetical protein